MPDQKPGTLTSKGLLFLEMDLPGFRCRMESRFCRSFFMFVAVIIVISTCEILIYRIYSEKKNRKE